MCWDLPAVGACRAAAQEPSDALPRLHWNADRRQRASHSTRRTGLADGAARRGQRCTAVPDDFACAHVSSAWLGGCDAHRRALRRRHAIVCSQVAHGQRRVSSSRALFAALARRCWPRGWSVAWTGNCALTSFTLSYNFIRAEYLRDSCAVRKLDEASAPIMLWLVPQASSRLKHGLKPLRFRAPASSTVPCAAARGRDTRCHQNKH